MCEGEKVRMRERMSVRVRESERERGKSFGAKKQKVTSGDFGLV